MSNSRNIRKSTITTADKIDIEIRKYVSDTYSGDANEDLRKAVLSVYNKLKTRMKLRGAYAYSPNNFRKYMDYMFKQYTLYVVKEERSEFDEDGDEIVYEVVIVSWKFDGEFKYIANVQRQGKWNKNRIENPSEETVTGASAKLIKSLSFFNCIADAKEYVESYFSEGNDYFEFLGKESNPTQRQISDADIDEIDEAEKVHNRENPDKPFRGVKTKFVKKVPLATFNQSPKEKTEIPEVNTSASSSYKTILSKNAPIVPQNVTKVVAPTQPAVGALLTVDKVTEFISFFKGVEVLDNKSKIDVMYNFIKASAGTNKIAECGVIFKAFSGNDDKVFVIQLLNRFFDGFNDYAEEEIPFVQCFKELSSAISSITKSFDPFTFYDTRVVSQTTGITVDGLKEYYKAISILPDESTKDALLLNYLLMKVTAEGNFDKDFAIILDTLPSLLPADSVCTIYRMLRTVLIANNRNSVFHSMMLYMTNYIISASEEN